MTATLRTEEAADGVLLLTLDRPAARNAIDLDLCEALSTALRDFAEDSRWRAAVITGAPSAFCAGLDLKVFSQPDAPRHLVGELIAGVARLPKPIIAAVNGAAFTGGLELALSCDFIIAAEEARFADTHARIAALSGSGMGARLPHAVGTRWAKQMMFGCAPIDAMTALRIGLANEVVPAAELIARATAIASQIGAHDPTLVGIMKDVLDRGAERTLGEALTLEQEALARRKAQAPARWRS